MQLKNSCEACVVDNFGYQEVTL